MTNPGLLSQGFPPSVAAARHFGPPASSRSRIRSPATAGGVPATCSSSAGAGQPLEGNDGEDDERRRRESNPLLRCCRPPPGRQAPAPSLLRSFPRRPCPRQESNLGFDLRRVVCASVTPRGRPSK